MLGVGPCAYDPLLKVIAEISSPAAITNGKLFIFFFFALPHTLSFPVRQFL